jgi:predicted small secreted protein
MIKRFSILAYSVLMLCLSACNTMEGAGQDIQKGGSSLEDSARKHNNY